MDGKTEKGEGIKENGKKTEWEQFEEYIKAVNKNRAAALKAEPKPASEPKPAPVPKPVPTPKSESKPAPKPEPASAPKPTVDKIPEDQYDAAKAGMLTEEELRDLLQGFSDERPAESNTPSEGAVEASAAPELSEAPEVPESPEAPELPEVPESPEAPKLPEAPESSDSDKSPESIDKDAIRAELLANSQRISEIENQIRSQQEEINRQQEEARSQQEEINRQQEAELQRQMEIEKRVAEANEELAQNVDEFMTNEELGRNVSQIMAEEEYAKNEQRLNEINQQLEEEYAKNEQRIAEIDRQIEEAQKKNPNRLVAINADWAYDKKEMAHDLAEQTLNREVSKGNLFDKLWKGTLFKKFYEKKYEKEFLAEKRANEDGKTVRDLIREQKQSVIERFTLGAIEGEDEDTHGGGYIHTKAGEKLVKADQETNAEIRHAIEQYAGYSLRAGEKVSDLNRKFSNHINRVIQEAIDDGRLGKSAKDTDYLAIAKQAAGLYKEAIARRGKAEHEMAMKEVMAGFQVYNAEVRNGVRTDAHRDNIDKIVNYLESTKIGQLIPAEVIAGVIGTVGGLTQTGARAVFGAAGGILASSAISGLKERNRITEDRARMMRDVAKGMDYEGKGKDYKKLKGVERYEARIGGTLYDVQKASDLTAKIKEAMNYEGKDRGRILMNAIAEARVRIDYSDSEQKDLIAYSSTENVGKERLELDKALIMAEKALTEKGKKDYKIMQAEIREKIIEDADKHDKDFKNIRTIAAVAKAGKTLALGSAIFLTSQEIMAIVDPQKIGIFEKAGLLKTANNLDAKETVLARIGGRGSYEVPGPGNPGGYSTVKNVTDQNEINRLEAEGYKKIKVKDAITSSEQSIKNVDPSNSTARVDVKYDGWANNGTKFSDGNELHAHIENGKFISTMRGASAYNGEAINYDTANIKAYLTVGDSKFEVLGELNDNGQLTWGENGVFRLATSDGSEATIKAIGDNGERLYKYFEIAAVRNVNDDVQHIIPLATDVGSDNFTGKIAQMVSMPKTEPAVYDLVKESIATPNTVTHLRDIALEGLGFAPETARTGLGAARASERPTGPNIPSEGSTGVSPEMLPGEPIEVVPEEDIEVLPEMPPEELTEVSPEASREALPETPPTSTEVSTLSGNTTVTTPESTSADFERWDNEIQQEINDNKDIIGGEDGVANLTDDSYMGPESETRWLNWWNSLSDEGKTFVKNIVKKIRSSDYQYDLKWGLGIRSWLEMNKYLN
ncbi:hypothetical protein IKG24_01600 [Candidatus Saccharibacteria bacterium]|nr:hypothetical protein [Candidatus Saccharibacteria bacterium]